MPTMASHLLLGKGGIVHSQLGVPVDIFVCTGILQMLSKHGVKESEIYLMMDGDMNNMTKQCITPMIIICP
jgi:hypothetical protein